MRSYWDWSPDMVTPPRTTPSTEKIPKNVNIKLDRVKNVKEKLNKR